LIRAAAAAALAGLILAAPAHAARFAVGVDRDVPLQRVAARLDAYGSVSYGLAQLHVLVVEAEHVRGSARIPGVRYVEWLGARNRRLAFAPTDPLVSRQWYLQAVHAFDLWPDPPVLPSVKVAIIDSGIDGTHPEFQNKIFASRSFVGGSAMTDQAGHGTFVAGVIAAALNNNEGIAGIAFPAELMVAKVVRPDRSVAVEAEAQAIRWAVDRGARVVNLSLGGLRDPKSAERDTYSPLEADAVDYAARKGAVLVAAVGNADQAPETPWPFASYPAALPHVIGVSAFARDGSVPLFSDRDPVYNDVAAPGQDIFSTLPRGMTKLLNPACPDQGYSDCGPDEYRRAEGTSFAAPQVAAAAALLLAVAPQLTASRVATLIERSTDDANVTTGCRSCPLGRDALTGWGRLNVAKALGALNGPLPGRDRLETNDDVSPTTPRLRTGLGTLTATIDFWDDPVDVYRLQLRARQRLTVTLAGPPRTAVDLLLWKPSTPTVLGTMSSRFRAAQAARSSVKQQIVYRVPKGAGGLYAVEVRAPSPGAGSYTLTWTRR
jgi:subtilisin family serine protease